MAKLVPKGTRCVLHWESLKSAFLRGFSIRSLSHSSVPPADSEGWPDSSLGKLGPKSERFPLPGLIASSHSLKPPTPAPFSLSPMEHMMETAEILDPASRLAHAHAMNGLDALELFDKVECSVESCPLLLKKDFCTLFPMSRLEDSNLTLVILCQKSVNDMVSWSPQVELEREKLLEQYIAGSRYICDSLKQGGYFADFIDPTSGKPFNSPHTNSTFFETDERYRFFGFDIEDHGCCKVISHHLWGSNVYVGCIFTTAPTTHHVFDLFGDE